MRKDIVALGFVAFLLFVIFSGTKIQTVDEYYLTHIDEITDESETVFISIECKTLLKNMNQLNPALKKYVPEDGIILAKTEYVLRPDDTVFDILHRAIRHNRIQMEFQGADKNVYSSVYIQGINHLYEFSAGSLSGWMYAVNEEFPNYGVSKYKLNDGDVISFHYTVDLGRDLGQSF